MKSERIPVKSFSADNGFIGKMQKLVREEVLPYQYNILNDAIPEEHKSGIDMGRDLLRRAHVLVVCGDAIDEAVKNDIAVAARLNITATTLAGILDVKRQGQEHDA